MQDEPLVNRRNCVCALNIVIILFRELQRKWLALLTLTFFSSFISPDKTKRLDSSLFVQKMFGSNHYTH